MDPRIDQRDRHIRLTPDEFAALPPKQEAVAIAAVITQDSLKNRLLQAIVEQGPLAGVPELIEAIRRPSDSFGPHEVTHLIYSLNKQGYVSFKAGRGKTKTDLLTDLKPTAKAKREFGIPRVPPRQQFNPEGGRIAGTSRAGHAVGKDYTEQKYHGNTAVGGPVERFTAPRQPDVTVADVVERPDSDAGHKPRTNEEPSETTEWPELQSLRARLARLEPLRARVAKLLEAAALLDGDEPDEAERLMAKAAELEDEANAGLTPIEAEYLAYAEIVEEMAGLHTK